MARKLLMTWTGKRWLKKYQGKMYSVSCRQLGCPETKEESYQKANTWWESKQAELNVKQDRLNLMLQDTLLTLAERRTTLSLERGQVAVLEKLQNLPEEIKELILPTLLPNISGLNHRVERAITRPTKNLTLEGAVGKFLAALKAGVTVGNLDLCRYDAYRRELAKFVAWFGADRSVVEIDEETVNAFYLFLLGRVAERRHFEASGRVLKQGEKKPGYKITYAKQIFGTFKQMVASLAETKVISLPGNLFSKRLKFRRNKTVPGNLSLAAR